MKVQVETLDGVRKKVEVLLPAEMVGDIREGIYEEVKKHAKIKGFRQGKIPKSIIIQYYKDYIDDEVKKKMVENTMFAALAEVNIDPLLEPRVDFIEKNGEQGYALECEVLPDIEIPEYRGITIEVEPVSVSDEDVARRTEGMQQMHAEIVAKPSDSSVEQNDFVIMKYQGYLNGEPVKEVNADAYPVELGNSMLMPEFESGLLGMKMGEEKDITITFPEDYPDKKIASKTLIFKVSVKEIKKKRLPQINDEFAKDLSYENMDALKQGIRDELIKEKTGVREREITQKIVDALLKDLEVPVPQRLLEKRLQGMIEETMSRYQQNRLSADEMSAIEARMKAEFGKRTEDRLRAEIVLARIAQKEGIKAEDAEVDERLKKIAEEANKTYDEIRSVYVQYNLMNGLKSAIIEEKTVNLLRDNAIIKEKA
ncbi:MAG TPA: trigger factor [Syntrophorhabdaceae bacterium]|nr:trigger factor [Syntrophorhabdaceae bacterium]